MTGEPTLRQVVRRSYRGVTALVVLLLAVIGTLFTVDLAHLQPEIRQTDQATRAVRQAHEGMLDQETGARGYLLADPVTARYFLEPYDAGRATTAANLAVAARAAEGNAELSALLRTAVERATLWQDTWAEPVMAGPPVAAADRSRFHVRGKTHFDSYRHADTALIEALKTRKDRLVVQQQTLFAVGLAAGVLASVLVLLGVQRQHRRLVCALVDPIGELATTVHRIRDGDLELGAALSTDQRTGRPAELTALGSDVQDMAGALLARDAEIARHRTMLVQAQRLAGLGSWELTVNGRALTWSEEMYAIKGVEPGTTVTTDMMLGMIHPDDREAMRQAVRRAALEGSVHRFDHRAIRTDGEVRQISGRVEGELDASGRPFRVTGTSQDVTAQHAAEQALAESEARYRLLAQNSGDLIARYRPDGPILYASPAARTLLGHDPAGLVGTLPLSWLHPDDVEHVRGDHAVLRDSTDRVVATHRIRHADGRWVWVESVSTAVRGAGGELLEIHSATRDISERLRAQEDLRRQAIVFEHISDSVLITDARGAILDCNAAAEQLSGYSKAALLGHVPGEHTDREVALERAAALVEHITEHGSRRADIEFIRADGQVRRIEAVTVAVRNHDGALTGMIDVSRDVTEERAAAAARERAAESVAEARDAALAATAAKSAFLATMSHEIRTPMNAVIGMTGLLLDTDLDAQQRDFVETVRTSGDALLGVINDILDFSKIEAGELDLEQLPFALRECVESALDLVAATGALKGLDLVYHLDPACPPHVLGDVTRLRQVLVNLLSNAVKFTDRGDVLVTVAPEPGPGASTLRFTVRDTGMGIPADRMDRLFKSFSQVDASTTRVHGGTGLGLAISQGLVQAMGGTLEATSVLGRGSSFTFTVTLAPVDAPAAAAPSTPIANLAGRSALIVDDNATNRRILRLQLESWGMSCTDVGTPAEARDLVADGSGFDLAILDMTMPAMDGDELATELHRLPTGRDLPLVLLTSIGRTPRRDEFAACLTKPVKTAALRDAVARTLVPEAVPDRPAQAPTPGHPGAALRILLAEDNAVNQKVGQLMLSKLGHRVDIAGNGREALEAVLRQPYDVVLMDVHMPEMDGLQATRSIRTQAPADRQPYIVAVTASALISDREACAAAGMDDYLPKPVRPDDLAAILRRLGRRGPGAAPAPASEPAGAIPDPTTTTAAVEHPAVDPRVLDDMLDQLGAARPATRAAVLESYLDQGAGWVGELVTAAHADDGETVSRIAHTMVSSSQIVGALPLAALLRDAEEAVRGGRDLSPYADLIETEYHRVAAALEALRERTETA
jgi:PAS domain S-box-containing protein